MRYLLSNLYFIGVLFYRANGEHPETHRKTHENWWRINDFDGDSTFDRVSGKPIRMDCALITRHTI